MGECAQNPIGQLHVILTGGSTMKQSMYGHQKHAVALYASIVLFMTVVLVGVFFSKGAIEGCLGLFYGSYEAETDAQDIFFSTVENAQAYIPEMRSPKLNFPLIATSLDGFSTDYLSFEDDGRPRLYRDQCLNSERDFPGLDEVEREALFTKVKHYPPPADLVEDGGSFVITADSHGKGNYTSLPPRPTDLVDR